jgi:hypothetical protein
MNEKESRRVMNKPITVFGCFVFASVTCTPTARAEVAPTAATVTVRANAPLGRITPIAVGANVAAWDGDLVNAGVPRLLSDAGIRILRYPGGSTSDNYHWMSNTPDDPTQGGTTPEANFDAYVSVVDAARAQAMITVNYGSGTAEEAASWVRYANQGGRHYKGPVPTYPGASTSGHDARIQYWEIGNELYGDGTYGATWEVNHNAHDPTTYANGVVGYSAAMKAVDPSIRIGLVVTAPGNWPDGVTDAASPLPWNDTVLPIACGAVDFVDVHWYPQGPTGESDAALLAAPQNGESTSVSYTPSIPSLVATLKGEIAAYCGAHAADVTIMVTETNSVSYNPGKQTTSLVDALFLDDAVMTWFENGVANVDWWAVHDSPFAGNADPSLYGTFDCGDYGFLSVGEACSNGAVEPPVDTPFPAYYGMQMLSHLGGASDTMLATTSSTSLVSVHAVRQENGKVSVMLIDKDPSLSYTVTVSLDGGCGRGLADVWTYGENSTDIAQTVTPVREPSFTIPVGPYSVTTVKLP